MRPTARYLWTELMPNPRLSTRFKLLKPVAPQLQRIRRIPVDRAKARHDRDGDFIFIHINKTAGSSIVDALGVPLEHRTAMEKVDQLGRDVWDSRLTFCVVRNPWDRAVSQYLHRRRTTRGGLTPDSEVSFKEWLHRSHVDVDPTFRNHERMFIQQYDWIHDTNTGERLVGEVLRFEDLASGFADVAERLGRGDLALPHRKRSTRTDYHDYYDDEAREIVAHAFSSDASTFGYSY